MVYGWVRYVPLPTRRVGLFRRRAERSGELARHETGEEVAPKLRRLVRRPRTGALREDIKDEAWLVRSKLRWSLATVAFLAILFSLGRIYAHDFESFLFLLGLGAPWFAALSKRAWLRSVASVAILVLAAAMENVHREPIVAGILAVPGFALLALSYHVRGRSPHVGPPGAVSSKTPPGEIRLHARPRSAAIRERCREDAVLPRSRIVACLLAWMLIVVSWVVELPARGFHWPYFVLPAAVVLPPLAAWSGRRWLRVGAAVLFAALGAGLLLETGTVVWACGYACPAAFFIYAAYRRP